MAVPPLDASAEVQQAVAQRGAGGQGCVGVQLTARHSSHKDSSSYFMASLVTTALIIFFHCTCNVALCVEIISR